MSFANHRRRFDVVGRPGGKAAHSYDAAVEALDRRLAEERAPALAMVALAQALAGTVMQPPEKSLAEPVAEPEEAPPAEPELPAGPKPRLDMHTPATLEQVLSEPWIETPPVDPNPPPPPKPRGFEAWGLEIPSYARRQPEDDHGDR